jgi:putative Holliday junction resolvase
MEKRLIGIDYGEVRIGVAISDPLNIFAYPLATLMNSDKFFSDLKKLLNDYSIEKIILGFPLKENGEPSLLAGKIEKFKIKLEQEFQIPVEFTDERYSSDIAKSRIIESVKSKKKRRDKGLLDKNAAAVLLQDYMDQK